MKQKAVFLDRDGVINNGDLYYTYKISDFIFNDELIESLELLTEHHFKLIVITNQGGISKGIYTKQDVDMVHDYMISELRKHNIHISEVYYCPHHDSLENCLCRKPDSSHIEKAIARFEIDPKASFLIGDGERDIAAGQKAGLSCFKIDKNESILKYCQAIISEK